MVFDRIRKAFKRAPQCSCAATQACVLTIDDDPTQRIMIQKTLEKKGMKVLLAATGEDGIDLAKMHTPDLILLDVMMPGVSGHEVCRQLKNDAVTENIPVIFLTAVNTPGSVVEHFDLGAEVHLTKPINAKELVQQVEITLNAKPR